MGIAHTMKKVDFNKLEEDINLFNETKYYWKIVFLIKVLNYISVYSINVLFLKYNSYQKKIYKLNNIFFVNA